MDRIVTENFVRVSKLEARKLVINPEVDLYMCHCKVDPENIWGLLHYIDDTTLDGFEMTVGAFEYYNLHPGKLGRYTAFYIPREQWEGLHK
jgi:hypothetical protein